MKVGEIEILPVLDGMIVSKLPANKPLPDPQSEAWQAQHGSFRPDGMHESTVGGFLIRTRDRLLLVDVGSGEPFVDGYTPPVIDPDDDSNPLVAMFRQRGAPTETIRQLANDYARTYIDRGHLPESLESIGVRPDDITDVVLTHLHFDHIGWTSTEGAAFFPNATVRCASADLDHFLPDPPEEKMVQIVYRAASVPERLGPVLDRIETWDSDCTLMPGIDIRLAPGHTPGSSVVVISDGAERAMLLGDMIHCPLELMDDEFNLLVDVDQEQANRVREAYSRELDGSDIPVAAAHFPGLRFGRLLPGKGVRRWTFDPN